MLDTVILCRFVPTTLSKWVLQSFPNSRCKNLRQASCPGQKAKVLSAYHPQMLIFCLVVELSLGEVRLLAAQIVESAVKDNLKPSSQLPESLY